MAASEQLEHRDQIVSIVAHTPEQAELLALFIKMLNDVSEDGGRKRSAGTKPSWKVDTHERQIFSHLYKWKKGERHDDHSGQHPLVHLAWRALAIAWQESQVDSDATSHKENVASSTSESESLDGTCCLEHLRQRSQGLEVRANPRHSNWDTPNIHLGGYRSVSGGNS